jgi:hypothetical protein
MRALFFTITIFFILTSCDSLVRVEPIEDNCTVQTFTNIDSALKCSEDPKNYKSLLFALISKDVEKYEKAGWNIFKDKDIINTAKKDYVLIIIDPLHINLSKQNTPKEFLDIIKQARHEPYFVVTNRAFYPFREFALSEKKENIIEELRVGLGP